MLRLEARPQPSKVMSFASPLLALALTVLIGMVMFALLGKDPLRALQMFFYEPIKSAYAWTEIAVKARDELPISSSGSSTRQGSKRRRPPRSAAACRRKPNARAPRRMSCFSSSMRVRALPMPIAISRIGCGAAASRF